MPSTAAQPRLLPALFSAWLILFFCIPAHASDPHSKNGNLILRMCKSADKVKMLSVMCNSYLDGYIDAAHRYGRGKTFCVDSGDRNAVSRAVVTWIEAHPEALTQPAADVMHQALAERFPCKGAR